MKKQLEDFLAITSYQSGQYDQDEGFQNLDAYISKFETESGFKDSSKHRIFYMGKFRPVDKRAYKAVMQNTYLNPIC